MAKKKHKLKDFGRYLTSAFILAGAGALLVVMSLMRKAPEESDNLDLMQTVSVFNAIDFDGKLEIEVSGLVEPHREIEMAAQVSGNVLTKSDLCRAGTYVTENTPLLTIDSANYDFTYRRNKAEKAQAEASIFELEQELENLNASIQLVQREYDLQKQEFDRKMRAGSALSQSERDQARRNLNASDRSLTELKNSRRLSGSRRVRLQTAIELSEVRLKEAELNKNRCQFNAPFDGVIVSDPVEKGDYVSMGKTVLVFEDTSKADVKCNLRFEQLQQIVKYQVPDSSYREATAAYKLPPTPVEIFRKGEDGLLTKWEGTLIRFDGIGVDAQTKMIPCRVVVDKPVTMETGQPKALVRGMFVNVNISLDVFCDEGESLLTFPVIAIRPGNHVWAVVDGKLKQIRVEVLDRKNTNDVDVRKRMVVVRVKSDALTAGAAIVTSPLAQPNPGSEVKIIGESNKDRASNNNSNQDQVGDPADSETSGVLTIPESIETVGEESEPRNAGKEKGATRS